MRTTAVSSASPVASEVVLRELNEQLTGLGGARAEQNIVCECAELACTDRITMSDASYEGMRGDARLFAVKPGHEDLRLEDVGGTPCRVPRRPKGRRGAGGDS